MKRVGYCFSFLIFFLTINLFGQFNTEAYLQFLNQTEDLTSQQLLDMNSAGLFLNSINTNAESTLFFDSISIKYELTDDENNLISKNGFVVSERLQKGSFGHQFEDIYHKDLPVFISSDAILHAFHASYDKILKNTELDVLIPRLKELLTALNVNFPSLKSRVSTQANVDQALMDLDVYLTVANKLLKNEITPHYSENQELVNELLADINSETFVERVLFSETPRKIDFSQFKPRGHYVDEYHPQLADYFKTMM